VSALLLQPFSVLSAALGWPILAVRATVGGVFLKNGWGADCVKSKMSKTGVVLTTGAMSVMIP